MWEATGGLTPSKISQLTNKMRSRAPNQLTWLAAVPKRKHQLRHLFRLPRHLNSGTSRLTTRCILRFLRGSYQYHRRPLFLVAPFSHELIPSSRFANIESSLPRLSQPSPQAMRQTSGEQVTFRRGQE